MSLVKMPDGYSQFQTCRPPVKLSRERWDSLRTAYPTAPHVKMITLLTPDEIDGITFLPATYVPASPTCR